MTDKKHNYDWDAMGFDPDDDRIFYAFKWFMTPQGHQWWSGNEFSPEGQAEFARMKRLYAEDMAAETGPVRTVTRKEIVPGVYGAVVVKDPIMGGSGVIVSMNESYWSSDTKAELTDAIETLTQIRDALDG